LTNIGRALTVETFVDAPRPPRLAQGPAGAANRRRGVADVADHFFRRRSPNERDALIVAGWKGFLYGLLDAIHAVERHLLEGMMEN